MRALSLLLATALLAGCGGEEFQDLRDFVKNAGTYMRGKVDPPSEIKPYEPFAYDNSAGLPDPFKPRSADVRGGERSGPNQPDARRPREALEEFPLDSLKMVGYLHQGSADYAVIQAPGGKLHRVRVGNYIGQNFGKITAVTETEVQIRETVQDGAGDWSVRMSSLQLME